MIAARERGRLLAALLLSAAIHLLAGGGLSWSLVAPDDLASPPIAARLAPSTRPAPVVSPKDEPPAPAAKARQATSRAISAPAVVPPPEEAVSAAPAAPVEAAEPEPLASATPYADQPEAAPGEPAAPLYPQLPTGFTVRYAVQGNEGGMVFGRLDHIWQRSDARYSLYAVAQASGLLSLIYAGLLTQTSYGEITAEGLKPEHYWLQRGRRQMQVKFDWAAMRADLGERYPPLELKPGSQDLLSVIYQLALFPRRADELPVLDGKSIKYYRLQDLGSETVEVPLGTFHARHLQVSDREGRERIDVWLRDAPPHLPLKIHMQGGRYGSAVLLAEAVRGIDQAFVPEATPAADSMRLGAD